VTSTALNELKKHVHQLLGGKGGYLEEQAELFGERDVVLQKEGKVDATEGAIKVLGWQERFMETGLFELGPADIATTRQELTKLLDPSHVDKVVAAEENAGMAAGSHEVEETEEYKRAKETLDHLQSEQPLTCADVFLIAQLMQQEAAKESPFAQYAPQPVDLPDDEPFKPAKDDGAQPLCIDGHYYLLTWTKDPPHLQVLHRRPEKGAPKKGRLVTAKAEKKLQSRVDELLRGESGYMKDMDLTGHIVGDAPIEAKDDGLDVLCWLHLFVALGDYKRPVEDNPADAFDVARRQFANMVEQRYPRKKADEHKPAAENSGMTGLHEVEGTKERANVALQNLIDRKLTSADVTLIAQLQQQEAAKDASAECAEYVPQAVDLPKDEPFKPAEHDGAQPLCIDGHYFLITWHKEAARIQVLYGRTKWRKKKTLAQQLKTRVEQLLGGDRGYLKAAADEFTDKTVESANFLRDSENADDDAIVVLEWQERFMKTGQFGRIGPEGTEPDVDLGATRRSLNEFLFDHATVDGQQGGPGAQVSSSPLGKIAGSAGQHARREIEWAEQEEKGHRPGAIDVEEEEGDEGDHGAAAVARKREALVARLRVEGLLPDDVTDCAQLLLANARGPNAHAHAQTANQKIQQVNRLFPESRPFERTEASRGVQPVFFKDHFYLIKYDKSTEPASVLVLHSRAKSCGDEAEQYLKKCVEELLGGDTEFNVKVCVPQDQGDIEGAAAVDACGVFVLAWMKAYWAGDTLEPPAQLDIATEREIIAAAVEKAGGVAAPQHKGGAAGVVKAATGSRRVELRRKAAMKGIMNRQQQEEAEKKRTKKKDEDVDEVLAANAAGWAVQTPAGNSESAGRPSDGEILAKSSGAEAEEKARERFEAERENYPSLKQLNKKTAERVCELVAPAAVCCGAVRSAQCMLGLYLVRTIEVLEQLDAMPHQTAVETANDAVRAASMAGDVTIDAEIQTVLKERSRFDKALKAFDETFWRARFADCTGLDTKDMFRLTVGIGNCWDDLRKKWRQDQLRERIKDWYFNNVTVSKLGDILVCAKVLNKKQRSILIKGGCTSSSKYHRSMRRASCTSCRIEHTYQRLRFCACSIRATGKSGSESSKKTSSSAKSSSAKSSSAKTRRRGLFARAYSSERVNDNRILLTAASCLNLC
jgi:hypothetical protein